VEAGIGADPQGATRLYQPGRDRRERATLAALATRRPAALRQL
jgi:hypothetical protein